MQRRVLFFFRFFFSEGRRIVEAGWKRLLDETFCGLPPLSDFVLRTCC